MLSALLGHAFSMVISHKSSAAWSISDPSSARKKHRIHSSSYTASRHEIYLALEVERQTQLILAQIPDKPDAEAIFYPSSPPFAIHFVSSKASIQKELQNLSWFVVDILLQSKTCVHFRYPNSRLTLFIRNAFCFLRYFVSIPTAEDMSGQERWHKIADSQSYCWIDADKKSNHWCMKTFMVPLQNLSMPSCNHSCFESCYIFCSISCSLQYDVIDDGLFCVIPVQQGWWDIPFLQCLDFPLWSISSIIQFQLGSSSVLHSLLAHLVSWWEL